MIGKYETLRSLIQKHGAIHQGHLIVLPDLNDVLNRLENKEQKIYTAYVKDLTLENLVLIYYEALDRTILAEELDYDSIAESLLKSTEGTTDENSSISEQDKMVRHVLEYLDEYEN